MTFGATETLPKQLAQKAGEPLDPEKVRESTRRLFASGRYRDMSVRGVRHGDSVTLIFAGVPRYYVGRVTIEGVRSERLTSLLEYATKLEPGTAFTEAAVPAGQEAIKQTLEQNGYYEPTVTVKTTKHERPAVGECDVHGGTGPQARVGDVTRDGPGPGSDGEGVPQEGEAEAAQQGDAGHDQQCADKLRAVYQKKDRLEARSRCEKQTYEPPTKQLDYDFQANQGPVVKVLIEGAKVSKSRLKLLVPIFEEGTVDNDLLNEGTHNIKDFLQQQGYFDATVEVKVIGEDTPAERVVYTVDKSVKHKVLTVDVQGQQVLRRRHCCESGCGCRRRTRTCAAGGTARRW